MPEATRTTERGFPTTERGVRTIELDEELLTDIRELIKDNARALLLNILADLHPADIADLIENLGDDGRRYVFGLLQSEVASDVLRELDESTREPLLADISHEKITEIVGELNSDDAADLIADLPSDVASRVLETIEAEDAANVQKLMRYPEDTAGGIMATEVLRVKMSDTVKMAIRKAREFAKQGFELYNMYVVDDSGELLGSLPVSDLILQGPGRKMRNVMKPVVSVKALMDQEEVANLMQKYDLVSVPVVNERNQIIGRITVDDIVDVINEEATEDIERMAGLVGSEEVSSSVFRTSRIRLPWLLLGFIGEMLSALVLKEFHASLETILASAFFIPLIMAMGGNAGIQSSAIVVRGLATGEVRLGQLGKRIGKEFGVAMTNGIILSVFIFGVSYVWFSDVRFGATVGLSLLAVVLNATIVGAAIPFLLERFKIDPAIATGPFITTTNDALGLLIYFGFMTLIYL
ncbi:MAG: magnesium transporter [Ignavibacteriae bacterium]|nr:magnesium transporter [Ignavibacteriota bacterium]